MNLDQIETKCFILALFIRDDGERFLLGSRAYEFLDSQLHFAANTYQNDVVEVQGNDGIMLAGQVRRATSQAFDGYIGDSSVDRPTIEQYRQAFLKFFRKNHYYKVVYVFPNGSAIQRRNGFIVEAPEVKELYQLFPQYHISMNFEDINYYEYKEDEDGQEIYGESASLNVSTSATGGLIWDAGTEATLSGEGTNFTLNSTIYGNSIDNVQLKGDTTQQTYSGKNLVSAEFHSETTFVNYGDNGFILTKPNTRTATLIFPTSLPAGTYTFSCNIVNNTVDNTVIIAIRSANAQMAAYNITAGTTGVVEFTATVNDPVTRIYIYINANATDNTSITFDKVQFEAGSSATTYEPYVGGIPSPNPDYPQEVQTVTGRQVVTVSDGGSQSQEYEINLGKNLLDMDATENGGINSNGVDAVAADNWRTIGYIDAEPNTTYTYSMNGSITANFHFLRFYQYDKDRNFISPRVESNAQSLTVATHSNTRYIRLSFYANVGTMTESMARGAKLQLEKGSTASSYAEYFTPIELCKIGTYQDYIYKSGDDWYVHKECGKVVLDGTSEGTWTYNSSAGHERFIINYPPIALQAPYASDTPKIQWSNYFTGSNWYHTYTGDLDNIISGHNNIHQIVVRATQFTSLNAFKNWLSGHNVTVYYALATATDNQITNASLISQLNALAGATTYAEHTVFTVTSENQLGILSLSTEALLGAGVVWDNYGATWEEGTGGGPTMISVDSIDNVYPIWEVTGPAVNPQISVLTTNTTLSYTGTVTASQVLKVDMFNKTATLNGTSVVGNVSGDWTYLAPGTNRVTYTTNNADAPDSTLWWQEIVG